MFLSLGNLLMMAFVIKLNAILWFLVPIIASREVMNAVILITKILVHFQYVDITRKW